MDFALTEDQKLMKDTVRNFLRKEFAVEYVRECDDAERFPKELFDRMAELGWLGMPIPEAYGGSGSSVMDLVLFLEELASGFEAAANIYYTTIVIAADAISHFGTESQKQEILPALAQGQIRCAFSLSEPDSGSDAAGLKTRAELDGDAWVVNGQKMFCSCAQDARWILLMTRTDPTAAKHHGITMFLLDPRTPGVERRKLRKLGLKPMDINEVFLRDVRIPRENVVGEVNRGWQQVLKTLDFERCCLSAVNVGTAQTATDLALRYSKERTQFGQPIANFQLTKAKLADMQMEIDAARLLLYRSAWMVDQGIQNPRESAMANLYSSEAYVRAALNGMRVMAGWGYLMEYDMQRHYRDAKLAEIGGGTSEILRLVISREMLR